MRGRELQPADTTPVPRRGTLADAASCVDAVDGLDLVRGEGLVSNVVIEAGQDFLFGTIGGFEWSQGDGDIAFVFPEGQSRVRYVPDSVEMVEGGRRGGRGRKFRSLWWSQGNLVGHGLASQDESRSTTMVIYIR